MLSFKCKSAINTGKVFQDVTFLYINWLHKSLNRYIAYSKAKEDFIFC